MNDDYITAIRDALAAGPDGWDWELWADCGHQEPRRSAYIAACHPERIARVLAALEKLAADNANLRTVMVAAAEEIAAHWDAHCDAEGYGPVNLQRRLEQVIPSRYGYTAGSFASLKAENSRLLAALEAAQKDAERLEFLMMEVNGAEFRRIGVEYGGGCKRAAIDAAMRR